MSYRIEIDVRGTTYPIHRDVATSHPSAVHEALGTTSESEIQRVLDGLNATDWYDKEGRHLGPDDSGLAMYILDEDGDDVYRYFGPCECCGCDCGEPATTTDDSGTPVCAACSCYAIDDDGDVHCARSGGIEQVTECCGAGGQTRTYYRIDD